MDGYDASPSYPILWYTVLSMSILCMYVCTWNQKKKAYPSSAKRTQITRSHEYQTKQTGVGRQGGKASIWFTKNWVYLFNPKSPQNPQVVCFTNLPGTRGPKQRRFPIAHMGLGGSCTRLGYTYLLNGLPETQSAPGFWGECWSRPPVEPDGDSWRSVDGRFERSAGEGTSTCSCTCTYTPVVACNAGAGVWV